MLHFQGNRNKGLTIVTDLDGFDVFAWIKNYVKRNVEYAH